MSSNGFTSTINFFQDLVNVSESLGASEDKLSTLKN